MDNFILKIKPYQVESQDKYPYSNGIIWTSSNLTRNCTSCILYCHLVYVWSEEYISETTGQLISNDIISEPLMEFEMTVPENILDSWGSDDSVIDNFVLSYDSNFELDI